MALREVRPNVSAGMRTLMLFFLCRSSSAIPLLISIRSLRGSGQLAQECPAYDCALFASMYISEAISHRLSACRCTTRIEQLSRSADRSSVEKALTADAQVSTDRDNVFAEHTQGDFGLCDQRALIEVGV